MKRMFRNLVMWLLQGYKWVVSPLFSPACRYVPTCAEYAMEAVDRHGVLRGSVLAAWRVLRCHPLAQGGYDPVGMPKDSRVTAERVAPSQSAVTE